MFHRRDNAGDIIEAARQIVQLVEAAPPHVRPWLRGIESEAEHVRLEVESADRRASRRLLTWLFAGLPEDATEEVGGV